MDSKDLARKIISDRRKKNIQIYKDNLEKLCSDPIFDELNNTKALLQYQYLSSKSKDDLIKIQEKLDANKQAMFDYLQKKNIPTNTLNLQYDCQLCLDTGIYNGKECPCVEKERIKIELSENTTLKNVPNSLKNIDFSYYKKDAETKKKCAEYIHEMLDKDEYTFYIFRGKPGTAKTYFAKTALKEQLYKGFSVKAYSTVQFNKELLNYCYAPMNMKNEVWAELTNYDYILLDDLGVESILKNITIQYFIELLEDCITYNKKLIITTNLSLDDIFERYDDRVFSRLRDSSNSLIINFTGDDIRLK